MAAGAALSAAGGQAISCGDMADDEMNQPADQAPEPGAAEAAQPARAARTVRPAKAATAKATKATKATKAPKKAAGAAGKAAPGPAKKAAAKPARKAAADPATSVEAAKGAGPATAMEPAEPTLAPVPIPEPEPPVPAVQERAEREPATRERAEPVPAPAPPLPPAVRESAPPGAWAEAVWEAVRHPGEPPQRLAGLAVAEVGPDAAEWAGWLRRTYPDAQPDGIARLAAQEARRYGWTPLAAGVTGPLAPFLHLAATAWVRAVLVMRIAAAYGHDPTDPARAADLVDLLGLADGAAHWSGVGSGFALVTLRRRRRNRLPLLVLRALLAVSEHSDSLDLLAHRATRHYRSRAGGQVGGQVRAAS